MPEFRQWRGACLTVPVSRIARLFTIRTRTEAWFVIYAIAFGAVERGPALPAHPQGNGWVLALACTAVGFLARAKLFGSVRPQPAKPSR